MVKKTINARTEDNDAKPEKPEIATFEDLCCDLEKRMGAPRLRREDLNRVLCYLAEAMWQHESILEILALAGRRRKVRSVIA